MAGGGARALRKRLGEVVSGAHDGGFVGTGDVYASGGRDLEAVALVSRPVGCRMDDEVRGRPTASENAMGHVMSG